MTTLEQHFRYNILNEAYSLTNLEEVQNAINTNKAGVKIQQCYKLDQGKISRNLAFGKFFDKCKELNVKDVTYGVQLLLSKCTKVEELKNAVNLDGLYTFLNSYKKPWVKQLPEYQEFMSNNYNMKIWHSLEKAIQDNQAKHGKQSKGSGSIKDVNVLYDDESWSLVSPTSFEGAKAASFYVENSKKTPTKWCTRAEQRYYDHYSKNAPLYIFMNKKNGRSYQMAFTKEYGSVKVHFLDQNDVRGDEVTYGDFSSIPDKLLSLVKIPFGANEGKTLLDYKKDEGVDTRKGEPGYIEKSKMSFRAAVDVPDNIVQLAVKRNPDFSIYTNAKIVKAESKNGYFDNEQLFPLSSYVSNGNKLISNYAKKAKVKRYFFKDNPERYVLFMYQGTPEPKATITSKELKTDPRTRGSEKDLAAYFLRTVEKFDSGYLRLDNKGEIINRYDQKQKATQEKEDQLNKKIDNIINLTEKMCSKELAALNVGAIAKMTKHELEPQGVFTKIQLPRGIYFAKTKQSGSMVAFELSYPKSLDYKNFKYTGKDDFYKTEEAKQNAWKIYRTMVSNWRKTFNNEIIKTRADGGRYIRNMYESDNQTSNQSQSILEKYKKNFLYCL